MKTPNEKKEGGISLLDILVVLAIIGIVAVITVPNISNWTQARTAENDIATIRALVDYAKSASSSKGKTMVLFQAGSKTLQIYQHISNDPTACLGNIFYLDSEYGNAKTLKSRILAKHDDRANVSSSFNHSRSRMCFKQDGTSTGGGFEVNYKNDTYRITIWQTGFYEVLKNVGGTWMEIS